MGEAAVHRIGLGGDLVQAETSCCQCGVIFTIPKVMYEQRRKTKDSFYCPNGHTLSFRKSIEESLREEIEAQKRVIEGARADAMRQREERNAAERREAAAKGQVTKLKNRVGHGVCPCCNRTFQNVQRHMTTKHPDFAHQDADGKATPKHASKGVP